MSVDTSTVQERPLGGDAGPAATSSGVSARSGPVIKCSVCAKVFKRSEHCARHELSHTNERPFSCQFCHRRYARKDLVKRHERTIHASLYNALDETNHVQPKRRKCTAAAADSRDPQPRPRPGEAQQARPGSAPRAGGGGESSNSTESASSGDEPGLITVTLTAALQTEQPLPPPPPPPQASRRATFSGPPHGHTSDVAASPPRAPSLFPLLPTSAAPVRVAGTEPAVARLGTTLPALNAGAPLPAPPYSPAQESGQFDFGVGNLLAESPFSALAEYQFQQQPHNQTRRPLHGPFDDFSSQHGMQDREHQLSLAVPSPMSGAGSRSQLDSSSLFDIDLMMGDVSNEFFFHQIAQQPDRALDATAATGHLLGAANDAAFVFPPKPSGHSPLEQSSDSISTSGTERSDQVRLPMILKEKSQNPPRLVADEAAFQAFSADVSQRLGTVDFSLPFKNRRELQHFLNGYVDCFHRHLPMLHLPTFDVSRAPSPLILAMCCIGGLYRLERQRARTIYLLAARISEAESMRHSYPSPLTSHCSGPLDGRDAHHESGLKPLWLMQARILMLLYATLGDDKAAAQSEVERMGIFITDYRARRSALRASSHQHTELQWLDWIEIEATRRYLGAQFICSSLLVLLYDIPPGFGITHDLEMEVLEEEKLWTAATAEDWQSLRDSQSPTPPRTIRSVMSDMLAGKTNDNSDDSLYHISSFTTLVVIHGVNMYAWNLGQFSHVYISPYSDLSGLTSNTLLSNALMTLGRCREVLQLAKPEGVESLWDNPEGPLLLNCEAMLRVAYTRLFLSTSLPEGLVLFLNSTDDKISLLANFVAARQERTSLVTKVMASMCEAFSVPAKAGYLLVQKTAAINWSVEHAVAGWGCVLLLSKWLHCLDVQLDNDPLDPAELEIVAQVKTALENMVMDYDEKGSLAAVVVASWAPLMTDVWVWGVTTKMGAILTELAQVYETSSKKAKRHRLKQ